MSGEMREIECIGNALRALRRGLQGGLRSRALSICKTI